MGSLDDAIKQHLELKLQHGADSEAVEEELQAALGPPLRDAPAEDAAPSELAEPDVEIPAPASETPVPGETIEFDWRKEESEQAAEIEVEPEHAPEPEPAATQQPPAPADLPAQPQPQAPPAPTEVKPEPYVTPVQEPPTEMPEGFGEVEDFDKLWFEEKPPRGFDF